MEITTGSALQLQSHEREETEEHEKLQAAMERQEVMVKDDHKKLDELFTYMGKHGAHEMEEFEKLRAEEEKDREMLRVLLARQEAQRVVEVRCAIVVTVIGLAAMVFAHGYDRKN